MILWETWLSRYANQETLMQMTRSQHERGFCKIIKAKIKAWKVAPQAPTYDQDSPPLYDLVAIQKLLPHRYPLLVDKIVHLDKKEFRG